MPSPSTDVRMELPAQPTSVGVARRLVRETLETAHRMDLAECAGLVVSEMVTNGIIHAGTAVSLSLGVDQNGLRIEVTDGSAHVPVKRRYVSTASTGRGIALLDHMVDQWGVELTATGKTVWAVVSSSDRMNGDAHETSYVPLRITPPQDLRDAAMITLLNVPLLLHAAWQMHVEALLRAYLYAQLSDDGGAATTELQLHAAAHDALTLLRNQIPSPDLDEDPDALMSAAVEPLVTHERLVLKMPVTSLPHFAILNDRCEAALELADAGQLATAPTQPELRLLRAWLCNQIDSQTDGSPPRPWEIPSQTVPPPYAVPAWDARPVLTSENSLIAADESNRILAISPPAVQLLGYDSAQELVGHRLVKIIPPRFHQAHLAGFTMHLASGREPLLNQSVHVPALRKDGNEQTIVLKVTITHVGDARIFLAEVENVDETPVTQAH